MCRRLELPQGAPLEVPRLLVHFIYAVRGTQGRSAGVTLPVPRPVPLSAPLGPPGHHQGKLHPPLQESKLREEDTHAAAERGLETSVTNQERKVKVKDEFLPLQCSPLWNPVMSFSLSLM